MNKKTVTNTTEETTERYIIVSSTTMRGLVNDVNARIDEGYAPCGGVAFLNSQPYQAMVLQP
jgi:hypothetical protein